MSRLSTLATVLLASIGYHGQVSEQRYARQHYDGIHVEPNPRARPVKRPPSNGARECARRRRQIEAGTLQCFSPPLRPPARRPI